MDLEVLKVIASQGVVGVLAYGMFMVYRKDMQERLAEALAQRSELIQVVKDNTEAMTALKGAIDADRDR